MEDVIINMNHKKDTKSTRVYESSDPNAAITQVYVKRTANPPDQITIVLGDRK